MKTACINCGAEVEDTATFCIECGSRPDILSKPLRKKVRNKRSWKGAAVMIVFGLLMIGFNTYMAYTDVVLGYTPNVMEGIFILLGFAVIFYETHQLRKTK